MKETKISQEMLSEYLVLADKVQELKAQIKISLESGVPVEEGPVTAEIVLYEKKTPDYKGYIAKNLGQKIVNYIVGATKATMIEKLIIKEN